MYRFKYNFLTTYNLPTRLGFPHYSTGDLAVAITVPLDVITGAKVNLVPATEKSPGSISSQFTSTEQYLGPATWAGTPPTVLIKSWRATQSGNMAAIAGYVKCSSPGLRVSKLTVPFPSGAPAPWLSAGIENNEWVALGIGAILTSKSADLPGGHTAGILKNSNGDLVVVVSSGGIALGALYARFYIPYLVGD